MQSPFDMPGFDDLADALAAAVAARLSGRLTPGPAGEPAMPPGLEPWPRRGDPTGPLGAGATLGIGGVEFTQSIQYGGSGGSGGAQSNAVPLVAYKTMVVRVDPFVRRGMLPSDTLTGQRVTGELTLSIGDRVVYRTGPTRREGARVGRGAQVERAMWDREFTVLGGGSGGMALEAPVPVNSPLNFVAPAYYCKPGRMHATVRLWPVAEGPASSRSASATAYLHFLNVPAPKVCLVRVNWTDSNGTVNRPTDAAMLATMGLASRMLPFPYFETTILSSEITSSAPFAMLAPDAGGCNASWDRLVAELNVTRIFTALFGLGSIVYGMVHAAAIPPGSGSINAGCGRGAGGGFVGFDTTFAHEIGHLYGRPHVAVAGDDTSDTAYPNYGRATSIGEVGIDTGTTPPTLYDPSSSDDIMSYGNNQWISPYTYQKILDGRYVDGVDRFQTAAVDPRRLRPVLVLDFRVYRTVRESTRVEIRKMALVEAAGTAPPRVVGGRSPLSLELLDANQRVVAAHHCTWAPAHGGGHCGCGCGGSAVPLERQPWLDFQEVIEWPGDEVASIDFHRGGEPVFTLAAGEPPTVAVDGPIRQEDGTLLLYVVADHPRERASVLVLFSADAGVTWQPVAYDPPDNRVVIEAASLPGGDQCLFRAVATAELRSATADTPAFDLPRTPRRLYLDVPGGDCPVAPGAVALSAMVDTRGLGAIAPREIRWSSDVDGELGAGYTLSPELSEGRHELTVTAPDGLGGTLAERGIIVVGG